MEHDLSALGESFGMEASPDVVAGAASTRTEIEARRRRVVDLSIEKNRLSERYDELFVVPVGETAIQRAWREAERTRVFRLYDKAGDDFRAAVRHLDELEARS